MPATAAVPVPFEYLVYTLKNVYVVGFQTAAPGGPLDTITLSFGEIDETYTHQNSDGSVGASVTATYNVTGSSGGTTVVVPPTNPSTSSEAMGLTFTASNGTTSNEIPVTSYSWGGMGGTGTPSLGDFQVVLSPDCAEPDLWGVLASNTSFPQVTLYARRTTSSGPFTYLTYTLKNAAVSSYQTASPGGVQDTIALSFGEIDEMYTHQNADGSAGTSVTVTYSITNGVLSGLNTMISLIGASIPVNGQLQFSVAVTGAAVGNFTNATGLVRSSNGGVGNSATASLQVLTNSDHWVGEGDGISWTDPRNWSKESPLFMMPCSLI